jgi:hypothetical protein
MSMLMLMGNWVPQRYKELENLHVPRYASFLLVGNSPRDGSTEQGTGILFCKNIQYMYINGSCLKLFAEPFAAFSCDNTNRDFE